MGKTGLVYHPAYLEHDMGMGHPESPNRLRAIVQQLEQSGTMAQLTRIAPRMAEDEWIAKVHTAAYLASLKQHAPASGRVSLDPDTSMSPGSLTAAYLAAGGALGRLVVGAPTVGDGPGPCDTSTAARPAPTSPSRSSVVTGASRPGCCCRSAPRRDGRGRASVSTPAPSAPGSRWPSS